MSDFDRAIPTILEHEGRRFTDHAWDPGGATKFGITLRYAIEAGAVDANGDGRPDIDLDLDDDGDIDAADIRLLDEPTARRVYRRWWDAQRYGLLVDQQVATKTFDLSINMGPGRAHRYLQLALGECGYALAADGVLGPRTLAAVNSAEARELLLEICAQQAAHYRRWIAAKADREVARTGLMNRASWPFTKGGYVA